MLVMSKPHRLGLHYYLRSFGRLSHVPTRGLCGLRALKWIPKDSSSVMKTWEESFLLS